MDWREWQSNADKRGFFEVGQEWCSPAKSLVHGELFHHYIGGGESSFLTLVESTDC